MQRTLGSDERNGRPRIVDDLHDSSLLKKAGKQPAHLSRTAPSRIIEIENVNSLIRKSQ